MKQRELDELKASHMPHEDRRRILSSELDLEKKREEEEVKKVGKKRPQEEKGEAELKLSDGLNWYLEGRCHLEGHGIEQNADEALHWLGKSAEEGEPRAMHLLGEMAEKGLGQRIDKQAAFNWYLKASRAEEKEGGLLRRDLVKNWWRLGKLYQLGGEPDFNEGKVDAQMAFYCFSKAANMKGKEALTELGLALMHGGIFVGKRAQLVQVKGC
mmetsp:Transcript_549/g.317  ORF Transcript_549/g.317 Transcript_549/m.317 type:complete len:213 (-) Transcript_549:245-883(-)